LGLGKSHLGNRFPVGHDYTLVKTVCSPRRGRHAERSNLNFIGGELNKALGSRKLMVHTVPPMSKTLRGGDSNSSRRGRAEEKRKDGWKIVKLALFR